MNNSHSADTIAKLQRAGLIEPAASPYPISSTINTHNRDEDSPWFLQLFLGISGLLSGLFLIGFFVLLLSATLEQTHMQLIIGTLLIAVSFFLFHTNNRRRHTFLSSLAFAVSIPGQSFLGFALFDPALDAPLGVWLLLLIQVALTALIPNFIHRLLSSFVAFGCLVYLLSFYNATEVSAGLIALITCVISLKRYDILQRVPTSWHATVSAISRAVAYAGALMLLSISVYYIAAEFGHNIDQYSGRFSFHYPLAQGLLVLASLYAAYLILKRYQVKLLSPAGLIIVFAITDLGLMSVYVSGLLAASLVIVIAMANSQRVLMGLGIFALVGYVFWYYYQLDTSLLLKAGSMLLVGIGILVIRWLLVSRYFATLRSSASHNATVHTPTRIQREEDPS